MAVREFTHFTIEFDMDFHMGRSEELMNILLDIAQKARERSLTLKHELRSENV